MENWLFPDNDAHSRRPIFSDSDVYSHNPFFLDSDAYDRRAFFSDIGPFFPNSGTYFRPPFYPDTGVYPRRPVADDKHWSTKPSRSAAKQGFTSRDDNSVPVHYANDKNRSGFADHKQRSTDGNSVPIHFSNNQRRSDFADHKHANDKHHNHRSTKPDRSAAAVKIQKIVRGFLVRKNIQRVRKITAEMAEIGHKISALKFCDNEKQRLRIGEMLMALLLRLDAVRGVREYRKKVICRVIQFQEAVDSIACEEINRESFGVGLSIEDSRRAEESMANKEALERAAAEKETLKMMAEELCERSRQQCDLLSGLVRRVENLESRVQDMEQREKETGNH